MSVLFAIAIAAVLIWGTARFSRRRNLEYGFILVMAAGLVGLVGVGLVLLATALPSKAHDYPGKVHRFKDADTFVGEILFPETYGTFRLYCIDARESMGAEKSDEGIAMSEQVKALKLRWVRIEVVKEDTFDRWLVWVTPQGWDITLNEWLYQRGAPLYDKLTRAERAVCAKRLGIEQ